MLSSSSSCDQSWRYPPETVWCVTQQISGPSELREQLSCSYTHLKILLTLWQCRHPFPVARAYPPDAEGRGRQRPYAALVTPGLVPLTVVGERVSLGAISIAPACHGAGKALHSMGKRASVPVLRSC
ncbi:hypothetical protein ROHU_018692 [Labeo rohita]|uniref:Uncharacterized protein n=1 Tax=Labeo rohita TaxID=84645 RepID=A0A498N9I6_LABRO|nr:hypothetical protein ROHU_018692 [Labeo rohita]